MNLRSLFPRASKSFLNLNETPNLCCLPNSKPQRDKAPALERANAGKTPGLRRIRVRFTGYRTRCLDPDNFAGSCKDLLDGLRHAGLIPSDSYWSIVFETAQEQVETHKEERTLIEIET